jgi:hypothetical protein
MDVQIMDHTTTNREAIADYEGRLDTLKRNLIFSKPERVIHHALDAFKTDLAPSKEDAEYIFNIKKNPLRLFHYALYASRAKYGIEESSFWHVVSELRGKGVISKEDEGVAVSILRLFIGLRHLIGISLPDTMDSVKINDKVLGALMSDQVRPILGEERSNTREDLINHIEESRQKLVGIAKKIFNHLGYNIQV